MLKSISLLTIFIICGHFVGNTQPPTVSVQKDSLLYAAILGADYLVNALNPDGSYIYEYNPKTGHISSNYNILRHAGTTYSILEVYEATGKEKYLEAAKRALEFLNSTIVPCKSENPNTSCVVENGEVKLGGNALAVIAMAKFTSLTGDDKYVPVMQSLASWMEVSMGVSGEFEVHKQSHPQGNRSRFISNYYPGEAILAFNRLFAVDGNSAWLDTAEKGAKWLINIRDMNKTQDDIGHDHWLLYALYDLYRSRPDPLYLKHAFRITESILLRQRQQTDTDHSDWIGSYYTPPRSTPTATRTEGLVSAYHLARLAGDILGTKHILNGINLGIQFELRTQCNRKRSEEFGNPTKALGGFFESLDTYNIRIDYVQHNISALLGYYNILMEKN